MSQSYSVVAIKPPDEKWKQMKAIWDACDLAKVSVPKEVSTYFNHQYPDPNGVVVDVSFKQVDGLRDGLAGFDVELASVPEDAKILRFLIHY